MNDITMIDRLIPFRVTTTFTDGTRDSYTRDSSDGFAAAQEALEKYGDRVRSVIAINIRRVPLGIGQAPALPVICIEGGLPDIA